MTRSTERPSHQESAPQASEPQTWPDRVRSQRDKAGRPLTIEELMQSSLEFRAAQRAERDASAPTDTAPSPGS